MAGLPAMRDVVRAAQGSVVAERGENARRDVDRLDESAFGPLIVPCICRVDLGAVLPYW